MSMPELAGTIPEVRLRPKVAKRATIAALPAPRKTAERQGEAPAEKSAVHSLHLVEEKKPRIIKQAPAKPDAPTALVGGTMPEKKPLVKAKKPLVRKAAGSAALQGATTSVAAVSAPMIAGTIPEKKPLVTKQAKAAAEPNEIPWTAGWMTWLPIAVGIALASVAPTLHAMAAMHDPWGLRVVFPFVQLAALHEIGMSDELTRTMPQLMLYLQFPLEGMLVAFNLRRGMKFYSAVGPIPALHFVAALTLWIVRLGDARPL